MTTNSTLLKAAALLGMGGSLAGLLFFPVFNAEERVTPRGNSECGAAGDTKEEPTAILPESRLVAVTAPPHEPVFPAPDRRALHPAERFAADATVLAAESRREDEGRWRRELLIRKPGRPSSFRVEEVWQDGPPGSPLRLVERRVLSASQLIARLPSGATSPELDGRLRAAGMTVDREIAPGVVVLRLAESELHGVPRALEMLSSLGIKAESDGVGFGAAGPNDPFFPGQWNLENTGQADGVAGVDIGALSFWATGVDTRSVTVAVLDTGMDFDHPDLQEADWKGYDFINRDEDPSDDNFSAEQQWFGHGTAVTGIIFAARDNDEGIAGLLPAARLLVVKVLDKDVSGLTSHLIEGLKYARENGAQVMNLSLIGYTAPGLFPVEDSILAEQLALCHEAGIILCIAAGNDGTDNDATPNYPSSYPDDHIIAVGAHDRQGRRWGGSNAQRGASNFGAASVDLFAPGESILAPGIPASVSVYSWTGTSFATPHVTAAVAALRALKPGWNARQIKSALFSSAVQSSDFSGLCVSGGRLDLAGAVAVVRSPDSEPPRLELLGAPSITLAPGADFTDPGARVLDNEDADRVIVSEDVVDSWSPGTYTLTYRTTDAADNAAVEITRTVLVLPRDYRKVRGTYLGNVSYNGEAVRISLVLRDGILTGQLRGAGSTVTLRGQLDGQGGWRRPLPPGQGGELAIRVQGVAGREVIRASLGTNPASHLRPAVAARFPLRGWRLNQLMTDANPGDWPAGFASLSADAQGVLRVVGRLGQGRPFTGSIRAVRDPVDSRFQVPVYLRVSPTAGRVAGTLFLDGLAGDGAPHIHGSLAYYDTLGAGPRVLDVLGRRWQPPASGNLLAGQGPAAAKSLDVQVQLGSDPPVALVWPRSNKAVNAGQGLRLSADRRTGAFNGRVKLPGSTGTIRGVLFREDFPLSAEGAGPRGWGLVQTPASVGEVRITVP